MKDIMQSMHKRCCFSYFAYLGGATAGECDIATVFVGSLPLPDAGLG